MEAQDDFDLDVVLAHLARLRPENVASLPFAELEWILADFVVCWGQRLLLEPGSWPEPAERERVRDFARTVCPFFIAPDFRVSGEQILTLALAATCLNLHTLYLDDSIDNAETARPEVKMAIPYVLERWFHLAATLFPPDSLFWEEARQAMLIMSRAMLAECRHWLKPLTLDEYMETARGRMAFTRVNSIGLAVLDSSTDRLPALYDFWDAFGLAAVVHDDVTDWREDYHNQSYSYLHTQVLFSSPFREEVEAGNLPDIRELGIALFYSDLAESLYDVAEAEMLRARAIASDNGYCKLVELSEQAHARLLNRQNAIAERKVQLLLGILS